ncbi:MAG: adenine nucleotide alpha hydrolase family protein [Nitrospira sp.]|nr:adenine nucleotide alpha hydrolase family protein [Nitrospira sp.]
MNCTKCPTSTRAIIDLPRHNAAFCKPCFTTFVQEQVARAIKSHRMFTPQDRILVAVSGGKDSLALWHILLTLGYRADALYVAGAGIRELATVLHRPTCSTCGTIKRYQFNRAAIEHNYDVMATGHNLDDEAARLLGNVLHWQEEYLDKQGPSLPASVEGFAKKVKPLCRLSEREIAAYAVVNGIDYIVEECPMAKGSKMLLYKEVLNRLETESPGTKQRFYWGFLDKQTRPTAAAESMTEKDQRTLHPCRSCGQPTTADTCTYCKMMAKAKAAAPRQ